LESSGAAWAATCSWGNNTLIGTISNEVGIFADGSIAGNAQVYNNSATGGSNANEVFAESNQVGVNLEVSNNTSDGPVGSLNAVEVGANTIRNGALNPSSQRCV
jgi:hypothetical protein